MEDAIDYWRRAIKISPWRADYQAELVPLYFKTRDWRRGQGLPGVPSALILPISLSGISSCGMSCT